MNLIKLPITYSRTNYRNMIGDEVWKNIGIARICFYLLDRRLQVI